MEATDTVGTAMEETVGLAVIAVIAETSAQAQVAWVTDTKVQQNLHRCRAEPLTK